MSRKRARHAAGGLLAVLVVGVLSGAWLSYGTAGEGEIKLKALEWQLPRTKEMLSLSKQQPVVFVSVQNYADWQKLKSFWNPTTETVADPLTGAKVTREIVKVKVPLGLSQGPKIPAENSLTAARWELGRDLYFDRILSSDTTVACATCHAPSLGFTDQMPTSLGIKRQRGGMNAPSVMNAAYNFHQFWDGRATSLEDQAQGPIQNPVEMFDSQGHAWHTTVQRVRNKPAYGKRFLETYGSDATRDNIAKAIACYERTVLNGNSVHDRAEFAMKLRVADEGGTDFTIQPDDYAGVLKEAVAKKDKTALAALELDAAKDAGRLQEVAGKLKQGRDLFFGKARCALCHVGDNFTDGQFHNLGVGVKDTKVPIESLGRYGAQMLGHKDPEMVGAFKTPGLRGLVGTFPYMHDGTEDTLEKVVDFYDRGGNPNEYLDPRMRDLEAEKAYLLSKRNGTAYSGPKVSLCGANETPIVPFALKLNAAEKAALVMFLRSLEGEIDPILMEPAREKGKG